MKNTDVLEVFKCSYLCLNDGQKMTNKIYTQSLASVDDAYGRIQSTLFPQRCHCETITGVAQNIGTALLMYQGHM